MEKKIFTDYAPEHLDLDEEEKQVFLDNFTKPKLIYEYAPYWYTPMFIDEDRFSKDIRRMMCNTKNEKISKYEISEEQLHYICNHLEWPTIAKFALHLRKYRKVKEFGIFDKTNMYFLHRDKRISVEDLKAFASKILILTKER